MSNKQALSVNSSTNEATRNLIQRLSVGPQNRPPRIIAFMSARSGEGTTTIARDYATTLASETNQKVLFIDASSVHGHYKARGVEPLGIVDAMVAGKGPGITIPSGGKGISVARWIEHDENRSMAGQVTHNADFWQTLLGSFNSLVIDAPSLQSSFDGVMLAAKADAVVLVVEAEKTPQAVIKNLRDTLTAAGAKIFGVVMNKRRYYIPEKVYKKL